MRNLKQLLIVICLLIGMHPVYAYEESDSMSVVIFKIIDGFTNESIAEKCDIRAFDMFGNIIGNRFKKSKSEPIEGPVLRKREFFLEISAEGYESKKHKCSVSLLAMKNRLNDYQIEQIEMFPKMNTKLLDEVTATATRVKMVMKGDTIEYNAAAFQLSEGSMLDNLVKALPGAELHENGQITVNGEFVSSLMVNGRDFFKGDPRVALSNLPAYTVNKIQVYHKADDMQNPNLPADMRKDPLVMNVKLKREYAKGLISNYEVGLGSTLYDRSDLKWLGRVFAMYYTPVQSIAVYANANNLNDTRQATSRGNWRKIDAGSGEITVKSAGLDYSNDNKPKQLSFNTTLQAERRNVSLGRQTFAETYLEGGNTFSRSTTDSRNNSTDLKWDGKMLKKWDWGRLEVSPNAFYRHNSHKSEEVSEKSNGEFDYSEEVPLLYQRRLKSNMTEDRWGVSLNTRLQFLSPWSFAINHIRIGVLGKYDAGKETGKNLDYLNYPSSPTLNLNEAQRSRLPDHSYLYRIDFSPFSFKYLWKNPRSKGFTYGELSYNYEQQFRSGSRTLERQNLDIVPSAAGAWMLDEMNSYKTTQLYRKHEINLSYFLQMFKSQLQIDLPFKFHNRTIDDYRFNEWLMLTKNDFTLEPKVRLYGKTAKKLNWDISWSLRRDLPDMMQMLTVSDSSNPLVLRLGNPDLRKASVNSLNLEFYQMELPYTGQWFFRANYSQYDHLIAIAQTYDRQSGLTTLQPRNINGNREASIRLSYQRAIDRKERFYVLNMIYPRWNRSVDYSSDNDSPLERLKVNAYNINEYFRLTWRYNSFSVNGIVDLKWNRLVSLSGVFTPFSYLDVNYGVSATSPLVWGIDLDTELMAYCRRGYAEQAMNTTDWVWNLTLSKAFGKSKQWVVKAIGFDILHQLPNTQRSVNAQGRTETRYNTVSSYALLTLTYRLDIKPKRK